MSNTICRKCNNRAFPSPSALRQHMRDAKTPHHYCEQCSRFFGSDGALYQVSIIFVISLETEPNSSLYWQHASAVHPSSISCGPCKRVFLTEFDLSVHLRSSTQHTQCNDSPLGFVDDMGLGKRAVKGRKAQQGRSRSSSCAVSPVAS